VTNIVFHQITDYFVKKKKRKKKKKKKRRRKNITF